MAKPAKRSAPAAAPAATPTKEAPQRISALIARGFDAGRVQREAADVLSSWATTMEADDLRERLDEVHEQLVEGVEAAQDMGSEIEPDDAASAKVHQRSLGALMAARDAFGLAVLSGDRVNPSTHCLTLIATGSHRCLRWFATGKGRAGKQQDSAADQHGRTD